VTLPSISEFQAFGIDACLANLEAVSLVRNRLIKVSIMSLRTVLSRVLIDFENYFTGRLSRNWGNLQCSLKIEQYKCAKSCEMTYVLTGVNFMSTSGKAVNRSGHDDDLAKKTNQMNSRHIVDLVAFVYMMDNCITS